MDWKAAFRYPFVDRGSRPKLLWGWLVAAIPLLNIAVEGYGLEIVREVRHGQEASLPEWKPGFWRMFSEGVRYTAIPLVYWLPVFSGFGLVGVLAGGPLFPQGPESEAAVLGSILALVFLLCSPVYLFLLSLMVPAITIRFAVDRRFASAFRWKRIVQDVNRARGHYALLVLVCLALTLGWIAFLVPLDIAIRNALPLHGVAGFVTGFVVSTALGAAGYLYVTLVSSHLFGQYARLADQPGEGASFGQSARLADGCGEGDFWDT